MCFLRQEFKGKIAQVFNNVCGTSLWNGRPVDPEGKEEPSSGFEAENASTTTTEAWGRGKVRKWKD